MFVPCPPSNLESDHVLSRSLGTDHARVEFLQRAPDIPGPLRRRDPAPRRRGLRALDGTNAEVAGFLDVAREKNWELVHVISAHANPAGCVTEEAFEDIVEVVEDAAAGAGGLDGI